MTPHCPSPASTASNSHGARRRRAAHPPPLSRHDLERDDVVHLRAVAEPAAADAADAERPADGQVLIVGQRRRAQPARQRALEQRAPGRPRIHVGARSADVVHRGQSAHVDHDARVDLRLTISPSGPARGPRRRSRAAARSRSAGPRHRPNPAPAQPEDGAARCNRSHPQRPAERRRRCAACHRRRETRARDVRPPPRPRPRPSREVKPDDERGRRRRLSQESTP